MSLPTSGIRSIQRNRRGPMSRQRSSRAKSLSSKYNRYTKQPGDNDERETLIDTVLETNGGNTFQRRNKKGSRNTYAPKRENDYNYVSEDRSYTSYDDRSIATFPSAFAIFEVPVFLRKREWMWHIFLIVVGVILYLFFYTLGTSVQRRSTRMNMDEFFPSQSQVIGTTDGGVKSTNSISPSEVTNIKEKAALNIDLDSNDDMVMSDTMGSLRGYNKLRVPMSMEEINDDRVEFRGENDAAVIRGQPIVEQEFHLEKSDNVEILNPAQGAPDEQHPDGKLEETQKVIDPQTIHQQATVNVDNIASDETTQSMSNEVIENKNNFVLQNDLQPSPSNLGESTEIPPKLTNQNSTDIDVGGEANIVISNEKLSLDLESPESLAFLETQGNTATEQTPDAVKKKSDDLDVEVEASSYSGKTDATENKIAAENKPLSQNSTGMGDRVGIENPVNGTIVSTQSLIDDVSGAITSVQNADTTASNTTSVPNSDTTTTDTSTSIQTNDTATPNLGESANPGMTISNQSTDKSITSQQNPVIDAIASSQRPEVASIQTNHVATPNLGEFANPGMTISNQSTDNSITYQQNPVINATASSQRPEVAVSNVI